MAMVKDQLFGKTMRKSYAKYQEILEMPNLLKIQKDSYQWFLDEGLQEVFRDVGTITDFSGKLELSFLDFSMRDQPKYTVEECVERDATYARPIKVRVRLRNTETDEIKEQEIFMGDFPIMTNGGTFVINGGERVIVSQIVRSPGMYYGHEVDKADQHTYTTTVIPYRGAWLEYETDNQGVFYVRIDKNRKLPITCLIRAMGVDTDAKIKELFGEDPLINATLEKDTCKTREESLLEIYRRLRPGEPPTVEMPRPIWTPCSLTPGAMMCPRWAGTSSTRRWTSGPGCPGRSWRSPLPIPSPVRFWLCPARPSPGPRPRSFLPMG